VRHALSGQKNWLKLQIRTFADVNLDERDPFRRDPCPIDENKDLMPSETLRDLQAGSSRTVKGGYWGVRAKYYAVVVAAIEKDKRRSGESKVVENGKEYLRVGVCAGQGREQLQEAEVFPPQLLVGKWNGTIIFPEGRLTVFYVVTEDSFVV